MLCVPKNAFVYKSYRMPGDPATALDTLTKRLLAQGLVKRNVSGTSSLVSFRYPSFFFSSKRPITCISRLTAEAWAGGGETVLRIGVTFTKIRVYTILILGFIWIGLPLVLAFLRSGPPDFSPFGVLVVPLGFLVHYSARGRAFRALKRLIESGDSASWIH